MPLLLLLGLLSLSFSAAAQYDAGGQNTQGANIDADKLDPATRARVRVEGAVSGIPREGSASAGASGDAAKARAGASASVEGGAALGATGVNTQPAVRTEQAEKQERRNRKADR
jgi:hypothetical protein